MYGVGVGLCAVKLYTRVYVTASKIVHVGLDMFWHYVYLDIWDDYIQFTQFYPSPTLLWAVDIVGGVPAAKFS